MFLSLRTPIAAFMIANWLGCSFIFSGRPPGAHDQMNYFDCPSDYAAPATDTVFFAADIVSAAVNGSNLSSISPAGNNNKQFRSNGCIRGQHPRHRPVWGFCHLRILQYIPVPRRQSRSAVPVTKQCKNKRAHWLRQRHRLQRSTPLRSRDLSITQSNLALVHPRQNCCLVLP